jgi:hypothetical protein
MVLINGISSRVGSSYIQFTEKKGIIKSCMGVREAAECSIFSSYAAVPVVFGAIPGGPGNRKTK